MQYTIVGDLHLTHNNIESVEKLFNIIEQLGNTVIMLGDTLDTKEIIRGKCLNLLMRHLRNSKLKWIFLIGNHCWFNLKCEDHSMEVFKVLSNVTIIDSPVVIKDLLLMPYFDDKELFKKNLKTFKAKYLIMHQGVMGFDYSNGFIATGEGNGEFLIEEFKGFSKVISGHFHKYATKDNLTFLGTPFSHSFGESDQTKYIGIFDSELGELKLMETPFASHKTLELDLSKEDSTNLLKKKLNNKDIFRVKLIGTEMQIKTFDQNLFQGVKFLEETTDSEQNEDIKLVDTDSNEQKFVTWAKDIKNLDEETITLGLTILGGSK